MRDVTGADLIDHLHDDHRVSMIRTLRGAAGRHLIALLDSAPGDPICHDAGTTRECLDWLHDRLSGRESRARMMTVPDGSNEEGGL